MVDLRHTAPLNTKLVDADGTVIGEATSGTQSPSLQKAIGLGAFPRRWRYWGVKSLSKCATKN